MENRIAFISCVNNEDLYSKCLEHIDNLIVPDGYSCEKIAIRGALSMTSGYNQAMAKSQAKYKVYLHQDTFIINRNFIIDFLNTFKKSPKIGLIGMIGVESFPLSGIWSDDPKRRYGKVIENSSTPSNELRPFPSNDFNGEYKIVKAVDGLMIITRYDIPWREDLFDGWDFYDVSQCIEFYRKGYQVCVPQQNQIWCIHDCGSVNLKNYDKYRLRFLDEYSKDIFTFGKLIPTLSAWNKKLRPYQKKLETLVKSYLKQRRK